MMKDRMHTRLLVAVIILYMILMGCNLIDPNKNIEKNIVDIKPGTFEISITGEIEKSFEGEAIYEILNGWGGSPIFWLALKDVPIPGEDYRVIDIIAGEKPGVGPHDIWDSEKRESMEDQFYVNYNDSDFIGIHGGYKSTGGKLNILSSSDNQLIGSLNASAYETVHVGDGEFQRITVQITGVFYAQEGSTGIILN